MSRSSMRVAFLGPPGTFAEEALRASATGEREEVPYPTVYETVMAVQAGEVERAVVPIENSLEGSVTATLDALAGEASDVRIVGEVVHSIHHQLVSRPGVALGDIRRVLSHPQALAQCARFVREHLGEAERVSRDSTAEAVRAVAESTGAWAAIGSRLSAELYGCRVLAADVEDRADNETRFVWLARADETAERSSAGSGPSASSSSRTKTSIVFWGFNDESPGALVRVLAELAERGINLTKIESRPRRVGLGHYMFFADLGGGLAEPAMAEALAALDRRVETLRVLGSYPAA